MCLRDRAATQEVVGAVPDDAFANRLSVNLSSGTPADDRGLAAAARGRGISWLSGAIMVPVDVIGTEHSLILYSGNRAGFDTHRESLEVLSPTADFVGDEHGAAALLDTAMLQVFFAAQH